MQVSLTLALFFCSDVIDWKKEPFFFFNLKGSIAHELFCGRNYAAVSYSQPMYTVREKENLFELID